MILVIKSTLMLEIKRFDLYCFGRFNIAAKVGNISAHAGPWTKINAMQNPACLQTKSLFLMSNSF